MRKKSHLTLGAKWESIQKNNGQFIRKFSVTVEWEKQRLQPVPGRNGANLPCWEDIEAVDFDNGKVFNSKNDAPYVIFNPVFIT